MLAVVAIRQPPCPLPAVLSTTRQSDSTADAANANQPGNATRQLDNATRPTDATAGSQSADSTHISASPTPCARTLSARSPLLALHGFTGCGADFQWLAAATDGCFDWYSLDFPGHGTEAAAPRSAHTPTAVTRRIHAALQHIRGSAPADDAPPACTALPYMRGSASTPNTPPPRTALPLLLGYSMGGRMALRYLAARGAATVRGVILIGASAGLADAGERRARRHADHALAERIQRQGVTAFTRYWNSLPLIASQSRSPYFEQLQHMRHTNSATGLACSLRGIGTGAVAPVHSHLPQITVPCLLLTGDADTKFTALAAQMALSLPRARHVVIAGAGHAPHWENPQATAEAIRNWAAQLAEDA